MAGQNILAFFSDLLLRVIPSPEIWGFILLAGFSGYMILRKFPMSAGSFVGMILVLNIASVIGGNFELLRSILWGISGAAVFLGWWKFIGKQ